MEKLVRQIVNATNEGIIGVDTCGDILYINNSVTRLLGYSEEELMGKNIHVMLHHHHKDGSVYSKTDCPLSHTLTKCEQHHTVNDVFWKKDNTPLYIEYTSAPFVDDNAVTGAIISFKSTVTDTQDEERLIKSVSHTESFLMCEELKNKANTLNHLLSAFVTQGEDTILLDAEVKDQMPQHALPVFFGEHEMSHNQDAEHVSSYINHEEVESMTKVETSTSSLEAENGSVLTAARSLKFGTWNWDLISNSFLTNDEYEVMLGYAAGTYSNTPDKWWQLVHPDDIERVAQNIQKAIEEQDVEYNCEYRMRRKDGSWMWVQDIATVTDRTSDGSATKLSGFHVDIDKKKCSDENLTKQVEKAEAANIAKSVFLANMSHEIRTPMNAIIGFSSILSKRLNDSSNQRYIQSIISSCQTLLGVINDVLDVSKIEAGKVDLKEDVVSLTHFTRDLETVFAMSMKDKGLAFNVILDPNLPEAIVIDELRLRQVLLNLLSNSLKFTDKGYVTLALKGENRTKNTMDLSLTVTDSGIGIPKASQAHIFKPFQQAEGQDNSKYAGTGLGLSITSKIVTLFNGDISVESEEDQGTSFHVSLPQVPIHRKEIKDYPIKEEFDISTLDFAPADVLIVDDVLNNREVAKDFLSQFANLTVHQASSGEDAIRVYEKVKPKLILMDLRMSTIDGYEATRRILKLDSDKEVKIIALTAHAFLDSQKEIEAVGFSGYIRKPYVEDELVNELVKFLPYTVLEKDVQPASDDFVIDFKNETVKAAMFNDLVKLMREGWYPLKEKHSMRLSKLFVAMLQKFNSKYSAAAMSSYLDELIEAQNTFDINASTRLIGLFPSLVEQLKEANAHYETMAS